MEARDDPFETDFPGNLEPIRLLGHGSMASVYLARDSALKRLVAIKFLNEELCQLERSRQRFEREAQAAARLAHPGITTVYSVGRNADERPYIEMEYVDGVNLEDLLHRRGAFDLSDVSRLVTQVATALAAAHEQNIVHRDVKPANILVDNASGNAKLTDFGVAAILQTGDSELTRLTREGERLGDPRYMSPEQLRGEPLTGQSDVYSLGIIAYEMLTGSGPFDDPEIPDVAAAHIRRPAPELSARRNDIPPWFSDVVKRCLSKRPEHRPTARDLASLVNEPGDAGDATSAANSNNPASHFLRELQQRRVYQAAAAYAAISFVLLQVVDLLLQPWPQLTIVYQLAVIACIAGLPITIVLAWIYDWRRGRLVRTDSDASESSGKAAPRRNLLVLALIASAGLAIVAAWMVLSH